MVSDGRLENLAFGIYRYTSGETTSFIDIKAAWMTAFPKEPAFHRLRKQPPDAIITGQTAAYIHGVGDLYQTPYTFIVQERKQTTRNNIKYLNWNIEEQDYRIIEGLPVATIERTIADLIQLKEDMSLVDDVARDAIAQGKPINADRLAYLLEPLAARNGYPRHDGRAFAKDLVERNADFHEELDKAFASMRSLYANNELFCELARKLPDLVSSMTVPSSTCSDIDFPNMISPTPNLESSVKKASESISAMLSKANAEHGEESKVDEV